ncbi:unnamed protein product [Adineta ricciae]|uniref:G-protein coupled receptors family 1 profile domain-containing protein n=1 Tax=Adineta ricciae TaxID=249248 RepID=A0A815LUB8_ADIRI|nr:unnamed protein product [Adineta ricciae]CAF1408833.1 unnamed protein product [Adineta ricciae]
MSNSTESISAALLLAPYQLNIWFGSFLWITGNFGCLCNLMVFRSRSFRKRTYSIYLFAAAIADFHYFNFVLITRILQNGFRISLMNRFTIICKLRQFSTVWGNVVSFGLFSCAVIDRFLSTHRSNAYRKWSNQSRLAYRIIFIVPFFWFLCFGHRIVLYSINNGACSPPANIVYLYYDNYFQVIFSSLTPALSMSVLAYYLLKNVRILRRRIVPEEIVPTVTQRGPSRISQMDKQLTVMLVTESIIATITYLPYAIQLTYSNITSGWYKTPLRLAWEQVGIEIIHLFSYIFFATSFYVSIISNVGFRRIFRRLFGKSRSNRQAQQNPSVAGIGTKATVPMNGICR